MNAFHLPTNPRDRALFASLPIVLAPRNEPMPELEIGRTRLVLADDGLYIEARSRVLHGRGQLAYVAGLPYGPVHTFIVNDAPRHKQPLLLAQAHQLAAIACPNEWAGLVVMRDGEPQLHTPASSEASPHRVSYDASGIDPLDVIWDLHSHGRGRAFFSGQDDLDDLANPSPVFFAGVIGRAHSAEPHFISRIVIAGREFDPVDLTECRHLAYAETL